MTPKERKKNVFWGIYEQLNVSRGTGMNQENLGLFKRTRDIGKSPLSLPGKTLQEGLTFPRTS